MVEISLSGSGEGLGRAIARGYSTRAFFGCGADAWTCEEGGMGPRDSRRGGFGHRPPGAGSDTAVLAGVALSADKSR